MYLLRLNFRFAYFKYSENTNFQKPLQPNTYICANKMLRSVGRAQPHRKKKNFFFLIFFLAEKDYHIKRMSRLLYHLTRELGMFIQGS